MMKKIYVDTFQTATRYKGTAVSKLVNRTIHELQLRSDVNISCVGEHTENRHWHMLVRLLLSFKYNVLVVSNPNTLIPPWKGYITFHDVIPYEQATGWKKKIFYLQYRLWMISANKIYTFSREVKEKLENILGGKSDKIKIVPFHLHDAYISLAERGQGVHKKNYVLGFGTGEPRKNLQRTLFLFSIIHSLKPDMELYLFGNSWAGKGYELVDELLSEYPLQNRVKHLHKVSLDELINLYSEAQLFLFPSLSEGVGAPPFEAVASGTKVILSDIDIFKELFSDYKNAFFIKLDDSSEDRSILARALLEPFDNEDYIQIKKHKLKYSVDIIAEDILC
ncbi:glycosyltransferase [Selenomonas sp. oral taxon 138]|uniref:glycosyltransferase n=1 Tax=Selenomonas sp. oral taxon 138 TaxID=712532 RepID=UPI0009F9E361|nr:glycosyltransferase [Selenomonas sp. oral taxon 138]